MGSATYTNNASTADASLEGCLALMDEVRRSIAGLPKKIKCSPRWLWQLKQCVRDRGLDLPMGIIPGIEVEVDETMDYLDFEIVERY